MELKFSLVLRGKDATLGAARQPFIQTGIEVEDLTNSLRSARIEGMKKLGAVFLALGLFPISGWGQTTSEVYGVYNLYPQGSSRVMAMGGAYAALSDDPSGVVANPAGLTFSKWKFDLSSTFTRVTNREAKTSTRVDDALPFDYQQYALLLGWESWALGFGWSNPYHLETDDLFYVTSQMNVQSGDVALAKRFGKYFSLGVSYHHELFEHTFEDESIYTPAARTTVEAENGHLRAGLIYKGKKGSIGIVWVQERIFDIDESANDQLASHAPFRDGISPQKITVGLSANIGKKMLLTIDFDTIDKVENGVYAGGGFQGVGTGIVILPKEHTILHGGIEYEAVKSRSTEVYVRAGGYEEPARLFEAKSRIHYTLGLEARFGPAVLSVAFDQADNFNNTSQGFSLAFGSL